MTTNREFFGRLFLAVLIVFPATWLIVKQRDSEATSARLARDQALIADERVNRTIDACNAFNETRKAQILTSEAVIQAAAASPPDWLTPEARLLLTAFVQRANRAAESATRPKVCTIESLNLQDLAGIAGH